MISTLAFVLRRRDVRDADRRYTLYTERLGKIDAIASGTRKIKSKLAGHLEPCAIVRVTLVNGTRQGWRLVAARREDSLFLPLLEDLTKFSAGVLALESVDALTKTEAPDDRIFHALRDFLSSLSPAPDTGAHVNEFLYTLLDVLGYRPLPEFVSGVSLIDTPFFQEHLHAPLLSRNFFSPAHF